MAVYLRNHSLFIYVGVNKASLLLPTTTLFAISNSYINDIKENDQKRGKLCCDDLNKNIISILIKYLEHH